jgi:hypothetical protein
LVTYMMYVEFGGFTTNSKPIVIKIKIKIKNNNNHIKIIKYVRFPSSITFFGPFYPSTKSYITTNKEKQNLNPTQARFLLPSCTGTTEFVRDSVPTKSINP